MIYLLILFLSVSPLTSAWAATTASPKNVSASDLYKQGLRQMQRGNYTKAMESFNRVRNYHRDDPASVLAQLAIAELHFKKKDFEQARFAYEEFAALHPRHKDLDLVVYRTGLSIYKRASQFAGRDQAATQAAVNVWAGFESRFPESKYSEEAKRFSIKARNRLANKELYVAKFYERKESWGSVRNRSEYLLRRFPSTEAEPEALELQGTALHAWGFTTEAERVKDRLAQLAPESRNMSRLETAMAKPAGSPPDERVFIRPYRIRGAVPPNQAAPQ